MIVDCQFLLSRVKDRLFLKRCIGLKVKIDKVYSGQLEFLCFLVKFTFNNVLLDYILVYTVRMGLNVVFRCVRDDLEFEESVNLCIIIFSMDQIEFKHLD